MQPRKTTVSTIVAAIFAITLIATTATARNLSISNQQVRANFREVRFSGLFGTTVCQVTVEGSFHSRTIAKVVGQLVGYITTVRLGPCATGTATVLSETLPWHVRYRGFQGTLPNITRTDADIINHSFRVRTPEGFNCLARSTPEMPTRIGFNREVVTGQITSANVTGSIETSCGIPGSFSSDNGPVRLLLTGELIFIRLI
ncbi:MAG TPA: hypothetical protein VF250_08120 [Conexibacter sp.]